MKNLDLGFILFIVCLMIMGFVVKNSLFAMATNVNPVGEGSSNRVKVEFKKYHPKLESVLGKLAEEYSKDKMAMQKFAGQRSILLEDDQVRVPFIWKKILGRYIK